MSIESFVPDQVFETDVSPFFHITHNFPFLFSDPTLEMLMEGEEPEETLGIRDN